MSFTKTAKALEGTGPPGIKQLDGTDAAERVPPLAGEVRRATVPASGRRHIVGTEPILRSGHTLDWRTRRGAARWLAPALGVHHAKALRGRRWPIPISFGRIARDGAIRALIPYDQGIAVNDAFDTRLHGSGPLSDHCQGNNPGEAHQPADLSGPLLLQPRCCIGHGFTSPNVVGVAGEVGKATGL